MSSSTPQSTSPDAAQRDKPAEPVPTAEPPPLAEQPPADAEPQPQTAAPVQPPPEPHEVPKPDPLLDERSGGREAYLKAQVTLADFRKLIGLPSDEESAYSARLPRWWAQAQQHAGDVEIESGIASRNVGIYETIRSEERRTMRQYVWYNTLVHGSLIVQMVVSASLILLAALPQEHHISLAVLGAANGVITGVLSLLRGQGLPGRLVQYSDGLRKVRETIEWLEKELKAGVRPVSYREIVRLREMYQQIRGEQHQNRPDSWSSGSSGHGDASALGDSH